MDSADARSDDCARDGDGPHAVYEGQRKATNHATATDGRLRVQRDPLQITQAPVIVYTCHCTDCQRITSSAFSLGMVIPDESFRLTGKAARAAAGGGLTAGDRVKSRWTCPDCGIWLYGNPRPGTRYPGMVRVVRGGTLDDTSWLRLTVHFWTRSKQPWVVVPEGATLYEMQPDPD